MVMQQGHIYYARLEPNDQHRTSGVRPVLVLTKTVINEYLQGAVCVPLTTHPPRKYHYQFDVKERPSSALHEQIRFIFNNQIVNHLCEAPSGTIDEIMKRLGAIIWPIEQNNAGGVS